MLAILARRFLGFALLLGAATVACGHSGTAPISQERCEAQPGFVLIESGPFQAGSDAEERDYGYRISAQALGDTPAAVRQAETRLREQGWFEGERDATQIDQPTFCMAVNLITQADYQAFVADSGHPSPGISAADYQEQGFLVHPYEAVEPYLWADGMPPPGKENHPVVLVSYADAVAYADWRGAQDGVSYRLPTALEWEKAARSDDGRYFPWGSEWQATATNWGENGPYGTSAVGAFPLSRSPYDVEDMAGNVFEYTSTLVGGDAEAVMKGCSWDDLPGFCRGAYRHTRPVESRHILFGFRLVLE